MIIAVIIRPKGAVVVLIAERYPHTQGRNQPHPLAELRWTTWRGSAEHMLRGVRGDSVSVPAKLLSLLDAYTQGRSVYTLSELSRRTGLPLTTTHRLVGELERWGGLERGADGQYRIGLRMVELAALCPRGTGLRDVALPFMQDLYEATHQNVQLAVREGTDGVYIERIAGREAVPVQTRIGAHWPLHATGVGLVLLAFAPPAVQETVLAAPLRRFTRSEVIRGTDAGQHRGRGRSEKRGRGTGPRPRFSRAVSISVSA